MNILVLEDERDIADDLREQVEELGHRVMGPAFDCSAALELIWRERPDLALLDTHVGSETCEVVLEECVRQGIPVLISSAQGRTDIPVFVGNHPLIQKPDAENTLGDVLGRLSVVG